MIYEECGDNRVQHCTRLSFFIFLLTVRPKTKGNHHSKFQLIRVRGEELYVREQTSRQPHSYPIALEDRFYYKNFIFSIL